MRSVKVTVGQDCLMIRKALVKFLCHTKCTLPMNQVDILIYLYQKCQLTEKKIKSDTCTYSLHNTCIYNYVYVHVNISY